MAPHSNSARCLLAVVVLLACGVVLQDRAPAQDTPATEGRTLFRDQVRALLTTKCLACHGGEKKSGRLDLSTRAGALAGGKKGTALQPGSAAKSSLYQRAADREMPPDNPLSPEQLDLLKRWIDAGAPYEDEPLTLKRAGANWWSLQPVRRPAIPAVTDPHWLRTPIDAFLLAKLTEKGLRPAPEVDRRTFIRRVTFDLIGLPPTPEEIEAFVNDAQPQAVEALVERLLASPAYGERWGRHWLDIVRHADSAGYEMNNPRFNAWPYRDWIIRAFNTDIPYPQMILEQLAGDTLAGADALSQAATGFLVGGPHDVLFTALPSEKIQRRADDLDDMVSTTGAAFLGLTVNCARCHNHKFDPIGQKDYYSLQAIFAGVHHSEREVSAPTKSLPPAETLRLKRELARVERLLDGHEVLADPAAIEARRPAVNAVCNVERLRPVDARFVRLTVFATSDRQAPALDEIEVWTAEAEPVNVALASSGAKVTASSTVEGNPYYKREHLNDGRYGYARSWVSTEAGKGTITLELSRIRRIDRILWGRDRQERFKDRLAIDYQIEVAVQPERWKVVASSQDRRRYSPTDPPEPLVPPNLSSAQETRYRELVARRAAILAELPGQGPTLVAYAGVFTEPEATHVLERGDPSKPGEKVSPGGIAVIRPALALPADAPEAERRAALARWLADPHNPLTARVMVNRVWQWHFGTGLVSTPSDFGYSGSPPSHPELLDWLASEFVRQGWQLKHLHRLIVLSAAYRQSGQLDPRALNLDRHNRLLWRMSPRRLEAEPLRDSLLAINGRLDRRMGGRGYYLWEPSTNYVTEYRPKKKLDADDYRRMIYQHRTRAQLDATFGVFDCPDATLAKPRRSVSTTVLQALNLLNASFMVDQAETFAQRLKGENEDVALQVERAFLLALGRKPSERERTASIALARTHGLPALCRAIYNTNEFLHVD